MKNKSKKSELIPPVYDIIINNDEMCISFVCRHLSVPVSALINQFEIEGDRLKLDISFPKSITDKFSDEHINLFQEQIVDCCLDTIIKVKDEYPHPRTINED